MFRILIAAILLTSAISTAAATEAGWALLRNGGQIVLMRHARAPGTGDPSNFDIERCATQRNLSEQGKLQARRIGALIAARAAPTEKVLSSRYCRTTETATLVFGAPLVETLEALDPLPAGETELEEAVSELLEVIRGYTGSGNFFLVTHDDVLRALVGTGAREGESVIVAPRDEGLAVIGRIVVN